MNKLINPFKFFTLLTFALAPILGKAGFGDNIEKKRTISKTYTVSGSDKLSIENSFGNVVVSTWDKNEIQVDVTIGVNAPTEEKALQMLDQISVDNKQSNQEITFKTDIGNMGKSKGNNNNGDDRKFFVDYKISMPSKNPLTIENSFGKTVVPAFEGIASLTSKFGELTTGNMENAKLIHVEFGQATVGTLNNTEVIFKFNGRSSVAGLSGNSKVHVEFCDHVNLSIDNKLTDLGLFESYSSIHLGVPENLSAHFEIHTNFGSFDNKTEFNIEEEREDEGSGPKFDKDYSGSAGSGAAKIKIKSSFGSIKMANVNDKSADKEDSEDDDKDKDKGKADM